MTPVLCAAEFWRNFKPRAPDMKVTVKAGHEVTIAFDAILVQGATDENSFSLSALYGEAWPVSGNIYPWGL